MWQFYNKEFKLRDTKTDFAEGRTLYLSKLWWSGDVLDIYPCSPVAADIQPKQVSSSTRSGGRENWYLCESGVWLGFWKWREAVSCVFRNDERALMCDDLSQTEKVSNGEQRRKCWRDRERQRKRDRGTQITKLKLRSFITGFFPFSSFYMLVLHPHSLSLSYSFHLTTDCKQTHTNELWLNAKRLQLVAKATDKCFCAVEVTWSSRMDCEANTVSSASLSDFLSQVNFVCGFFVLSSLFFYFLLLSLSFCFFLLPGLLLLILFLKKNHLTHDSL